MEGVILALMAVFTFLVIVPGFVRYRIRMGRRNRAYGEIARRYGGALSRGGVFRNPRVTFRYGQGSALLRTRKHHHGWCEELELQWPDRKAQICIANLGEPSIPAAARRWARLTPEGESGVHYFVAAKDSHDGSTILSDGVLWQTRQLHESLGRNSIVITIRHGTLVIRKATRIRKFADLELFVRLALHWYDQALLTQIEGIEFVTDGEPQVLGDVTCKVCGDMIEDEMVLCVRCRTPHHRDCWVFAGKCSVYGCQETRFAAPRIASPVSSNTDSQGARP